MNPSSHRHRWLLVAGGAAALLALYTGGCFVPAPDFTGKACSAEHPCRVGDACCGGICLPGDQPCPASSGCPPETNREFCARLGTQCGVLTGLDACDAGRTVDCGGCAEPASCGGGGLEGICGEPGCQSETNQAFCARFDAGCGEVTALDSCGVARTLSCGRCAAPETCGGGGRAYTCGCTPESDAELCAGRCGQVGVTDRCYRDRVVSCGGCSLPETCGGAGTPRTCGCVSLGGSCLDAGAAPACCAGTCGASGSCCLPVGAPCTGGVAGECCAGSCGGANGTCCLPKDTPCTANFQCCSRNCEVVCK